MRAEEFGCSFSQRAVTLMDIDTNGGGTPMVILFVQSFQMLGIAWLSETPSRSSVCVCASVCGHLNQPFLLHF